MTINTLYLGISEDGTAAGDRRRFLAFASNCKNLSVDLSFQPGKTYHLLVCALGGDIAKAINLAEHIPLVVFDYSDHYLAEGRPILGFLRTTVGAVIRGRAVRFAGFKKLIMQIIERADLTICPSIVHEKALKELTDSVARVTDFLGKEIPRLEVSEGDGSLFWEGQAVNLLSLVGISEPVNARRGAINIVSDPYFGKLGGRLFQQDSREFCGRHFERASFFDWSKRTLAKIASSSSLGVIPIDTSDPFLVAKPENKLVFMWMLGLPALCSPTPSYLQLAKQTGVDFICYDKKDWAEKLNTFLSDSEFRTHTGQVLQNYARENYSDALLFERWRNAFNTLELDIEC